MALWHWKEESIKVEIAIVNDLYRYTITDTAAGMQALLKQDSAATLPEAKKQVFQYLERMKSI